MKPVYISYLLLCFACMACADKTSSSETSVSENEVLVTKVFFYFNQHNWKNMADLYQDPAEFKDPSFGQYPIMQSRDQIVQKYSVLSDLFPDIRDSVVSIYPSGKNWVVVEFISKGTDSLDNHWTLPVCTLFQIKNGEIAKDYTYYDLP